MGSTAVGGQTQQVWFEAVNAFARATPWLHAPAIAYAEYGVVLFAALLVVTWLWVRRTGDLPRIVAALWAPLGVLAAVGVNQLLVSGVAEQRPYTAMPHALVLVSRSSDYSFPSDHAVMAGAVAVGVLLAHRRLGMLAATLAVLMAATRVYVGAHYPLDVLAGLVVGAVVAWASYLIARPVFGRLVVALTRTPARPLVLASASDRNA